MPRRADERMSKEGSHREIERKFLVRRLPANLEEFPHAQIEQGYLAVGKEGLQVRLRRAGRKLSLTYKRDEGTVRQEREIQLSPEQFDVLWPATADKRLAKTRYDIPHGDRVIEIDVYHEKHEGLVVAEVEFEDEESGRAFHPPEWLGTDVTGNRRYSNVLLAG